MITLNTIHNTGIMVMSIRIITAMNTTMLLPIMVMPVATLHRLCRQV